MKRCSLSMLLDIRFMTQPIRDGNLTAANKRLTLFSSTLGCHTSEFGDSLPSSCHVVCCLFGWIILLCPFKDKKMLEDLMKHNKKPTTTRGFPWRGLRSLVDDNATAGANTIGQVSTTSTPPTDLQVISESCDWCMMESPWTRRNEEDLDPDTDDDIVENCSHHDNGNLQQQQQQQLHHNKNYNTAAASATCIKKTSRKGIVEKDKIGSHHHDTAKSLPL